MSLSSVPADVVQKHLFPYLSPRDRVCLTLTCKKFYRLLTNLERLCNWTNYQPTKAQLQQQMEKETRVATAVEIATKTPCRSRNATRGGQWLVHCPCGQLIKRKNIVKHGRKCGDGKHYQTSIEMVKCSFCYTCGPIFQLCPWAVLPETTRPRLLFGVECSYCHQKLGTHKYQIYRRDWLCCSAPVCMDCVPETCMYCLQTVYCWKRHVCIQLPARWCQYLNKKGILSCDNPHCTNNFELHFLCQDMLSIRQVPYCESHWVLTDNVEIDIHVVENFQNQMIVSRGGLLTMVVTGDPYDNDNPHVVGHCYNKIWTWHNLKK